MTVKGINATGMISRIREDGQIEVSIEGVGTISCPYSQLSSAIVPEPEKEEGKTERDGKGRFVKGHQSYGVNPDNKQKRLEAKQLQKELLGQLAPILRNSGQLIQSIKDPEKRINATAKLLPYAMPALSHVDYSDTTPRSQSTEEQLKVAIDMRKRKIEIQKTNNE